MLADCVEFVLLINVAFDMIGATFELLMLNFLDEDAGGDELDASPNNGTSSEEL
jgi:hypothetical protein